MKQFLKLFILYSLPKIYLQQDCYSRCATCFGLSYNQCTSCFDAQHRYLLYSQNGECICQNGYIQPQSQNNADTCDTCHYSCSACSGTSSSQCTQNCASYNNRNNFDISEGRCLCIDGYYDGGQAFCPPCHYSCANCIANTASSCKSCSDNTRQLIADQQTYIGTCSCSQNYHDTGVAKCKPNCHYSCTTCKLGGLTSTDCISCSSSNFRTIDIIASTCQCNGGYYDNGGSVCASCHYSCITCSGSLITNCLTCDQTTDFRTLQSSSCVCNTGYFENGVLLCGKCHYSCITCSGASSTGCLTCDTSTDIRTIQSSSCICNTGYFDNGVAICAQCHYSCITCSGSSTHCLTCDLTSDFRTLSASNTCPCNNHYRDTGVIQCARNLFIFNQTACHYSCITCSGASKTTCLTCDPTNDFRTFQTSTKICLCNDRYYDNGIEICACTLFNLYQSECHYSCITCSGALVTNCLTCSKSADMRTLNSTTHKCLCNTGYFDNSVSVCAACHYTCITCNNSKYTDCLTCDSSKGFRTQNSNTCPCIPGYRDTGIDICAPCHYSCTTCGGPQSTKCQTCNIFLNFRSFSSSQCLCTAGYYDNKVTICANCHVSCITCTGPSNSSCLTCDSTNNHRTLNKTTCLCDKGYFENKTAVCATCQYSCITCNGALSKNCLSCDQTTDFRTLQSNKCLCNTGYFDDSVPVCANCHYSCLNCNTTTKLGCTSCNVTNLRGNLTTYQTCLCQNALCASFFYFQDKGCDYSCLTCTASGIYGCSSCNPANHRTFSNNSCLCNQDFQDANNTSPICLITCDVTCLTCSDASNQGCLTCDSTPPTFRNLSTNQMCLCNNHYKAGANGICTYLTCTQSQYFDQGKQQCGNCDYSCSSCSGPTNQQCINCDTTSFRTLINNTQCKCNNGYLDQFQPICSQNCEPGYKIANKCYICHPLCSRCTGGSPLDCTACQLNQYDELNTNQNGQQHYQNNPINLVLNGKSYICENSVSSLLVAANSQNDTYFVNISSINIKTGEIVLQDSYDTMDLVIPQQTFKAGSQYLVTVEAQKVQQRRILTRTKSPQIFRTSFNLSIPRVPKNVNLAGGNREIGNIQDLIIQCVVFDFDNPNNKLLDLSSYNFTWTCNAVANGAQCLDQDGEILKISSSGPNLTVSSRGFVPYNSYQFNVVVFDSQESKQYTALAFYQIVDESVPVLLIDFDPNILALPINLNLMQQFVYNYEKHINPDDLFYSANLFYDFEIVSTIIYHYSTVNFRIWDYFEGFTNASGTKFQFKGQVYNPRFLRPSMFTILMNVNIPPQMCQIQVTPSEGMELTDLFLIQVLNCQDPDPSLRYRFAYYQSQKDYDQDNQLQSMAKASLQTSFQALNLLQTYLPKNVGGIQSNIIIGDHVVLILSVQDSKGGVSNYTMNIKVNPQPLVSETKLMKIISKISDTASQLRYLQVISASLRNSNATFTNLSTLMTQIINNTHKLNLTQEQSNQVLQIQAFTSTQVTDQQIPITQLQFSSEILINQIQQQMNYQNANPSSILNQQTQQTLLILNTQLDSQQILGSTMLANLNSQQDPTLEKNSSQFQSINEQNQQIMILMNQTRQIQIIQMIPNEGTKILISNSSTQAVALTTKKRLTEMLGQNIIDNTQNVFADQSVDSGQNFYTFSYLKYAENPYSSDAIYPYADQGFSSTDLQITSQQNLNFTKSTLKNSANIVPTKQVEFKINQKRITNKLLSTQPLANITNINTTKPIVCVSLVKGIGWSAKECETITTMGKISCQCKTINPTTVVDDFKGLFNNANTQIFQPSSLKAIATFQWQKVILVWIIGFITLIYIVMLPVGWKRDKKDRIEELYLSYDNSPRVGMQIKNLLSSEKNQLDKKEINQENGINQIEVKNKEGSLSQLQLDKSKVPYNTSRFDVHENQKKQFNFNADTHNLILDPNNGRYVDVIESPKSLRQLYELIDNSLKIAEQKQNKENEQTVSQYLQINHNYLNVYYSYEVLQRPIRASLLYLCLISSLAVTLYFGSNLNFVQKIILGVLSSVATTIIMMTLKALLSAKPIFFKIVGILLFLSLSSFLIYVILAVIATTKSISQTNDWSIQYSISLVMDSTICAIPPIVIKYYFFR